MSYDPDRYSPPPEKQRYGPQRAYGRPPPRAPESSSSSFFSNAKGFEISGGKFNNVAGDMNESTTNDYSTKSNFNNDYQNSKNYSDEAVHNDGLRNGRGGPVQRGSRGRQYYPQDRGYAQRRPAYYDDDNEYGYDHPDDRDFDDRESYYNQPESRHVPVYDQTPRDGGRYASSGPRQKDPASEAKDKLIAKALDFVGSRKDGAKLLDEFLAKGVSK